MQAVQVTLQVPEEIKILGDALDALIADLIAKKGVAQIGQDTLPALMSAFSSIAQVPVDLKASPDARAYLAVVVERAIDPLIAGSVSTPAA